MTFDQLEIMESIVEKGSFKAAAKHLRRTQPTLSVAIKKLEAEFELTLFSRDEYRPKLTDEGRVFFERAKLALQAFRGAEVVGKELGIKKAEPRLVVIVDPIAPFSTIEVVVGECLHEMAATELVLRSEIISVGTDLIRRGEADFAITPKVDDEDDIEAVPLAKVEMLPVVAGVAPSVLIDGAWLREKPQIVVTSVEDGGRGETRGLLDGGRRCFVTDHALKRRLILEGLGWGRLARHEVAGGLKDGALVAIPSAAAASFTLELHAIRSKQKPMGPVARSLWARLRGLEGDQS